MSKQYYRHIIEWGGGIITCGEHLAVFVSDPRNAVKCPSGWVFVDVTSTTPEMLAEIVPVAKAGRSGWPSKA